MSATAVNSASNGILLLDKPIGITSNHALGIAKRLFGMKKKAGHTGSLDPLASGMLPLCFGEATKFARFMLEADKCYHVVAKLGQTTTTGDAEGEITSCKPVPELTPAQIESVLAQFRGEILQIPPMFSALKHRGKPLYAYARSGQTIERQGRTVQIFKLTLEDIQQVQVEGTLQTTLSMSVECSKGTYIRTLVEDIGNQLGCGAHVIGLRRVWVGGFQAFPMVTMDELHQAPDRQSLLLPIDIGLHAYPAVTLTESMTYYIRTGQAIRIGQIMPGWISIKNHLNQFIGMGQYLDDGRIAPKRMLQDF